RLSICTCSRTGRHLATFTRRPGSSLYTLTTASAQVAKSGQVITSSQVSRSGQLAASFSCRVLSHQSLLWHHRLGHPSLPRLRSMHSHLLISGLPRSLPSLPCSPAPPCLPRVKGRQRAAPHVKTVIFPLTTAPLQTLHMDVWGPAPVGGTDQERYFLLVVDDYTRYTTIFPLHCKADVSGVLIPWICATRLQLRDRFSRDLPVLRLHSDRGETLPTLRWTGRVGDASVFRVWGALSLVRDTTASKLSPRTLCYGLAPSGVSQVDPPPLVEPLEISSDSSGPAEGGDPTADDTAAIRRSPCLETPPGFPPRLSSPPPQPAAVDSGAETAGAEPGRVEVETEVSGGVATGDAGSGGAENGGAASPGGDGGSCHASVGGTSPGGAGGTAGGTSGAAGAGGAGLGGLASAGGAGGVGGAAGAGGTRGATGARGTGAAGAVGAGATGAGSAGGAGGTAGAGGSKGATGAGGTGATSPTGPRGAGGAGGTTGARGTGAAGAGGAGAAASARGAGTSTAGAPTEFPVAGTTPPLLFPQLLPHSPLPAPAPYTAVTDSLYERREPETRASTPERQEPKTHASTPGRREPETRASIRCRVPRVHRSCAPGVPGTHDMTLHPSSVPRRVACLHLLSLLFSLTAMDAEMASWKSTGTYVDEVPPPGANIVYGMWIFRVKRPPSSPPAFKARYVARGFTQRDYEPHSLDFSTAFLQGSLHEAIWLRRPSSFTGSFPEGT
ncbi:unnamed protein product, partial [Closterium sp. NIES-54]